MWCDSKQYMLTTYVPLLCALVKPDPATMGKAKTPIQDFVLGMTIGF